MNRGWWWILIFTLFLVDFSLWTVVFSLVSFPFLRVIFFDVGQGDAIFIQSPYGYQFVIDGGPNENLIKKIEKYLPFWDKTIDAIILSHCESDHVSGFLDLLKEYKVDYVVWNGILKETQKCQQWTSLLEKEGAKIVIIDQKRKIITADNLQFLFLWPSEKGLNEDPNNLSVVCQLNFKEVAFFFPGDVSAKIERRFLKEKIESDVLKVAHHGSRFSSDLGFLRAVSPEFAVISVGKNSYGHPHLETLIRLSSIGAKILKTNVLGDIQFISDGRVLKLVY